MIEPALALPGLLVLVIAVSLGVVLRRDLTRFEVDYGALGVAAGAMLALILWRAGPLGALEALAIATLPGLVAEALRRYRPGRMGAGDPWLFAALGLAAGPDYMLVTLIAACLLGCVVALVCSRLRGRCLFGSMVPAALALVPAMALAITLRLVDGAGGLPAGMHALAVPLDPGDAFGLLFAAGAFLFGLWLGPRRPARPGARRGGFHPTPKGEKP